MNIYGIIKKLYPQCEFNCKNLKKQSIWAKCLIDSIRERKTTNKAEISLIRK